MISKRRTRAAGPSRRWTLAAAACVALVSSCDSPTDARAPVEDARAPHDAGSLSQAAPVVTTKAAKSGTSIDLGDSREMLCAIQSIQGRLQTYGAESSELADAGTSAGAATSPDRGPSMGAEAGADAAAVAADDAGESDGGSTLATEVMLYVDATSAHWTLTSEGDVRATIGCVPWSAFGGSPRLVQIPNAGDYVDAADPSQTAPLPSADCYLSAVQGDFGNVGQAATIDDAGFVVSRPLDDSAWAVATCFSGASAIPFTDVDIAAAATASSATLPSPAQAFCALRAVGGMDTGTSSVAVDKGSLDAVNANGGVRCFAYPIEAAGAAGDL
jgi:hypothetical protein